MRILINKNALLLISLGLFSGSVNAAEWLIDSIINVGYAYDDNVYLTEDPKTSVTSLTVQPEISLAVNEKDWNTKINARLKNNNYSIDNLDTTDRFIDVMGQYNLERDTFTLNAGHNVHSSLDEESTEFGLSSIQVNRETNNIAPSYTRMLTERLMISASYTNMEVDYDEITNSRFVPYGINVGALSVGYNLTERNKLTGSVQYIDYASNDGFFEYQMTVSRVGIERQVDNTMKVDLQLGNSQRESTNRSTGTLDFFGNTVTLIQEFGVKDSGAVYEAGLSKNLLTGSVSGRLRRDVETNSFGGANEVNSALANYDGKLSERWGYGINGRYEKTKALITSTSFADRNTLALSAVTYYSISRDWKIHVSYRYSEREYVSQQLSSKPESNRYYVSLRYNMPNITTY